MNHTDPHPWWHALLDAADMGLAYLDADGRHVHVNEVYARWLERDAAELVGKRVEDVFDAATQARLVPDAGTVELPMGLKCVHHVASDGSAGWLVVHTGVMPRSLIDRILIAQEEERRRLARELHDGVGQTLGATVLRLGALAVAPDLESAHEEARALQRHAQSTLDELSRTAKALHPRLLEELGFAEAVSHQTAEIGHTHHIEVDLQLVGIESAELPRPIASTLYRIILEALTNVVRHAEAQTVSVVVQREAGHIRAIVEDDGRGFDVRQPTRGIGLLGIQERVSLLGGTVQIDSVPGDGTSVVVRVPAT